MNTAPPVLALPLFLVTPPLILELYISTLSPVTLIVPPLDVLGSDGSPVLVPILLSKVHPSIIPSLPSQYIAPPSSPASLSVNVEPYTLQSSPLIYNAPASSITLPLVNIELFIMALLPDTYIAPPYKALQSSKVHVSTKVLLPIMYIAPPEGESSELVLEPV